MTRLFVVPTPIGNLQDITLRALHVLREVPIILAEDTRHTRKLLSAHDVHTRLLSFHQHNARQRMGRVLAMFAEGDVALVTDAGMPAISDPGLELVEAAVAAGVNVQVLPGPSACITAVVAAGLSAPGFLFLGFLPRISGQRRAVLEGVRHLPYELVLYEAPHRLLAALRDLEAVLGDRRAVVARELSKLHEEVVRGTLGSLRAEFESREPRGEMTIVVEGMATVSPDRSAEALAEMRRLVGAGMRRQAATGQIMKSFGIGRNAAYKMWLQSRDEESRPHEAPSGSGGA